MRVVRISIGAVLLVVVASAALAGVWMLRQAGGGGLAVRVEFNDAKNLAPDDDVIYGDGIVGRVESVAQLNGRQVVTARIAAENASLVREGSRFWIQSNLGSSILLFDTPKKGGAAIKPGHTFNGLPEAPEPDPELAPPAAPRKLTARPSWLCELRASLELKAGGDLTETQQRKVTGVVAGERENGDLLVLAPSWAVEYSGELAAESYRVELIGGATHVAEILAVRLPFVVLRVPASEYKGNAAPFWPDALADGQGLLLTDFEGNAFTAVHTAGEVQLRARTGLGLVALVDGTNVAGFTLPAVGQPEGVRWVPLNGAGTAIEEAAAKLK
ncbi:MAG: MCE family protein [Planctomycetes bacterium]|nr:MCE family protein [Planctomycetota bacterium]